MKRDEDATLPAPFRDAGLLLLLALVIGSVRIEGPSPPAPPARGVAAAPAGYQEPPRETRATLHLRMAPRS